MDKAHNVQGGGVRRAALISAAIVAMGLLLSGDRLLTVKSQAEAQTDSGPNIVFLMTDDLDERSMQDLPGIREVMSTNGTIFRNAYVTYSLCCPSRATILRGQYPITTRSSAIRCPRVAKRSFETWVLISQQ